MAAQFLAEMPRTAYSQVAMGFSPSGLERLKLDRLNELRAVIDSLRSERAAALPQDALSRIAGSRR